MQESTLASLLIAVVTSIPPTLAALASWRQSKSTKRTTDALAVKTNEIHSATNGNYTIIVDQLTAALLVVDKLQNELNAYKKNRRIGDKEIT